MVESTQGRIHKMETLQCADPKSLMPSAFKLNMGNFKVANVEASSCILKSDGDGTNNTGRPMSIILTPAPSTTSNYVHILRCPVCEFSTLLLSTLKEHIKRNHSDLDTVCVLSCPLCGGSSTERNLLEEHVKIYHRNNDVCLFYADLCVMIIAYYYYYILSSIDIFL